MPIFERVSSNNLREVDYLRANPDARQAVAEGVCQDARSHFAILGHDGPRFQYQSAAAEPPITRVEGAYQGQGLASLLPFPLEKLSVHLGDAYHAIHAPLGFMDQEKIGISEQFLDQGHVYHEKYFKPTHFKNMISRALAVSGKTFINPTILDLGSGTGNTVFACLELFENSAILATDLSPQLLYILTVLKATHYPDAPVFCVAMDALAVNTTPSSFDLFIGGAILHHLIDIQPVFDCAYHALRPNGSALFFEPMLSGHTKLLSLFYALLKMNRYFAEQIDAATIDFINKVILDWQVRSSVYEQMEYCKISDLDDKWLFTTEHIVAEARRAGFQDVRIANIRRSPRFLQEVNALIRHIGKTAADLPDWANEMIAAFDEGDRLYQSNDVLLTAAIVCNK